ncbi:hypothetical protein [Streptosporangium sp. NPDC001681]|uniref:hypothetical protein n=1 Tax=Streptosporangium sp. NPDC001681 TaxID=3154395 RepID=UPI003333CB84
MQQLIDATRTYRIALPQENWFETCNVADPRHVARLIRVAGRSGLHIEVTPVTALRVANACSWCRARPRAWEHDCDGPYERAVCDNDQCREARRRAYEGEIAYPSYH